jgi:ATP/maltotriose-dependent transcriptional regulator MalT
MIRFDSLTCAMLTVAAHAAAFRSELDPDGESAPLTAREQACLGLAARGRSGGQIAAQLNISARTVRFHLDNAREKLGVATRGAATRKALTLGLIEVPNDR